MTPTPHTPPHWDTASLGLEAAASAHKHGALTAHLTECGARRQRLQVLWIGANDLRQVLTARLVTSAVLMTSALGAGWWLRS